MRTGETRRIAERDAWIAGSAFVAEDGSPVVWYHGTDIDDPFNVFIRWDDFSIGFHFGSHEAANDRIHAIAGSRDEAADGGTIIPMLCRARNPLRIRDHMTWERHRILGELVDLGIVDDETGEAILDTWQDEYIFAAIEAAGYDCIVYANECEFKERQTDSLIVWRAELLKSPFAASFDRGDPRLLPQNPTDDGDMKAWKSLADDIAAAREALPGLLESREPTFA